MSRIQTNWFKLVERKYGIKKCGEKVGKSQKISQDWASAEEKKNQTKVLQAFSFGLRFFRRHAATADGNSSLLLTKIIVRLEVMEFPVNNKFQVQDGGSS